MSIVGLERALYAYVKDASHTAPFDLKTVPLATTPMQDQVVKPGKPGEINPDIKMHILLTVLHAFLMELVRRICLNIKTSCPW